MWDRTHRAAGEDSSWADSSAQREHAFKCVLGEAPPSLEWTPY